MLKMGRSMKEVADWLGHADIQTSMNIYGHLDMGTKEDVANSFSSLLSIGS
jgi:integrase